MKITLADAAAFTAAAMSVVFFWLAAHGKLVPALFALAAVLGALFLTLNEEIRGRD